MEKAWQDVLDRFHYGIYLVTMVTPEGQNGMIASWVTQCSHEPPLIALSIRKNRLSHDQILETKAFCINVLPQKHAGMIGQFKIADWKNKFNATGFTLTPAGLPVLDDAIGYLDCVLERVIDTGDHSLFIGEITGGAMINTTDPVTLTTNDYNGVYRGAK